MSRLPRRAPLALFTRHALLAGMALAPLAAQADEAGDGLAPRTLDSVVVTASLKEQLITEAPASVSVITREQLQQRPFANLGDALRQVEGVSVVGASANKQDISVRGMPGKYTLILVDGHRQGSREGLNREELGPVQASQIPPLQAIERIEVVRGPMSSLYGSDAIGGVVNVITRKPADRWTGALDLDLTAQQHSELGNSRGANFYLSGPIKPDLLSLQLFGKDSRRTEADVVDGGYQSEDKSGTARFSLTPTADQQWLLEAGAQKLQRHGTPGRTVAATGSALDLGASRSHFLLEHVGHWDFGTSDVSVTREQTRYRNTVANTASTTYPDTQVTNTVVDANLSLPLPGNDLVVGGQFQRTRLEGTDNEAANAAGARNTMHGLGATTWALFGEDQYHLGEDLTLTAGARMDHHDKYGSHWSPRLYAVYHLAEGWSLRGGISRAFRAPELRQIAEGYYQATGGSTGAPRGVIPGNPDLKPETSTSSELGIRYDAASGLAFGLTVFNNDFKNKIFSQCVSGCSGSSGATYAWGNIGRAVLRGVETTLELPLAEQWQLSANYTYTDSKRKSDDELAFDGTSLKGQPLDRTPEHLGNVRLGWQPTQALSLYANTQVQSEQYWANFRNGALGTRRRPGATTYDLGGSYAFSDKLSVRLALLNLTDKQVPVDYRARTGGLDGNWQVDEGRRLWLGLGLAF